MRVVFQFAICAMAWASLAILPGALAAQPEFDVQLPRLANLTMLSGRLVVYLLAGRTDIDPADGVFFNKPRPMCGITISNLKPGDIVHVDDSADCYPEKLSLLPSGDYRAQAVLVTHHDCSDWQIDPGNYFSKPVAIKMPATHATTQPLPIRLDLTEQTKEPVIPPLPAGLELFSIPSKLLSDFCGHEVRLNATVLLPTHLQPGKRYPALYQVPGYGGRHWAGIAVAKKRIEHPTTQPVETRLNDNLFNIFLDPETPTGHSLFCDSDVNGPWGKALTTELIPALEAKYPLIAEPMARLLRGHSSGGWSTLWLATEYPQIFGATWTTSPDPVSFHRFESSDLYEQENFYRRTDSAGAETIFPSFRKDGVILHVEEENRMENVVGPRNTSGEQWASWVSCWGRRGSDGHAITPWDPVTGRIDHREAETFRRFDILDRLEKHPDQYGPLFEQRVRLAVGGADNFYLNEAVELLKARLDTMRFNDLPEGEHGYITIVPGRTHSTLFASRELADFPEQMLEHLRLHHYLPVPTTLPDRADAGPIRINPIRWQTADGNVRGFEAVIDLTDPRLKIQVTGAIDHPAGAAAQVNAKLLPVNQWAEVHHSALAINANYFGWKKGGGQIIGLVVNDGQVISPMRRWHGKDDPALVLVKDQSGYAGRIIGPGQPAIDPTRIRFAVAGVGGSDSDPERGTLLVQSGRNLGSTARVAPQQPLARTAIGVDREGHHLILIVIDGRQNDWSVGATLPELARRMIDAGANDAINLDGGGSSSFVFQPDGADQPAITNRPCDESATGKPGVFRPVAVQLGFGINR